MITLFGDLDEPPLVNVFGAMVGTEAETFALLDELVARIAPTHLDGLAKRLLR